VVVSSTEHNRAILGERRSETALDKIDMPNRRLFVADFNDGTMNEIHLDTKASLIPKD
jgi:hypothetical protein